MAGKKKVKSGRLTVVHADCAGIDIGKSHHYVAVDPERFDNPVRKFGSFTSDLGAVAQWLSACGVRQVAMESTSVYWIPMFEFLDRAGFDVMLVPPRMTKQISGRKSDVLDCQWIRQLLSYGLVRGSYRPDDGLCPLRSLVRQCKRLTEDRSRSVLHLQKALTEMNVQLDSVISDLMGATGQRILRAIVDGERDPQVLAAMRDRRIKSSASTLAASLEGTWREEHLFALKQALERYDFFDAQVSACEAAILAALKALSPPEDPEDGDTGASAPPQGKPEKANRTLHTSLRRMMGVDLTAIPTIGPETALVIACEIGPNLSAFPTMQHFCSWLGLAPGTRISGDRKLRSKGRTPVNRVGQALRMAAMSARRSQSYIGAKHRSRLARMDTRVAIKATAHELARMVYLMLSRGQPFVERGIECFEEERRSRQVKHLHRKARALGFSLTEATAPVA